jgi:CheY-like chemotaxis protein
MDDPRRGYAESAPLAKRVLVAHADAGARSRLAGLLRGLGYEPVQAQDVDAGLRVLRKGTVDIALLSVRLAGPGGRPGLHLQLRPFTSLLPIILIGESGAMSFLSQALGDPVRGFPSVNGYLGEPVRGDELAFLLHKVSQARPCPDDGRPDSELAARRRHLHRLGLLGRLLGGVAQDLNHLHTAIVGFSRFLQERLGDDPCREATAEIPKAGARAAALTRRLLTISHTAAPRPVSINLNTLLADLERVLHCLLPRDVALVVEPEPSLGLVHADPAQLDQAVVALVLDGCDAMPHGGTITLRTANRTRAPRISASGFVDWWPPAAGASVELTVVDTGAGVDEESRASVSEPATPNCGEAAWLARAVVADLVRQNGGRSAVTRLPGHGRIATVLLPRIAEVAGSTEWPTRTNAMLPPPALTPPGCPPPTILVVESHLGVRALVSEVLRQGGCTVLDAQHGAEGIEVVRNHQGSIDLLVTDVIMPHLDGLQLARRLAGLRPNLKVLYISGAAAAAVEQPGARSPGVAFLQKQFTPDQLMGAVRSLLEGARE